MKWKAPMAAIRVGTLIDWTAHMVELFVEHQSMPSSELVDFTAFALRNDLSVNTLVPVANARLALALIGSAVATLCVTCMTMLPSFFSNFSGRAVLMSSGILVSIALRSALPAPAPENQP